MDREIQQAVDTLLLEQGMYAPLELLLAEGRLRYSDYEHWRGGELEVLETHLFGDHTQCRRLLRSAAEYCAVLGLEAQTQSYGLWGGEPSRTLCFSPDATTQRMFSTCYQKSAEQPQLDLFMDSTGSTLANGVALALCDRDTNEARRLLDRLFREDSGNARAGGLECLVQAAERIEIAPEAPDRDLEVLENDLLPLAEVLLGASKRNFLIPQWQRLGEAYASRAFDLAAPKRHLSYIAAKAEDWEAVRASVEAELGWEDNPVLLDRHARACARLHLDDLSLRDWFCFCWQFPEQASAFVTDAGGEWSRRWRQFTDADPELPEIEFPSWILVTYPGLAQIAPDETTLADTCVPASYSIVLKLARATAEGNIDDEVISGRRLLKDYSPALFEHYMNTRGSG